MRRLFAQLLHEEMKINKDIYLLTGDLGYGMWDKIRDDYPDRFYNVGSAEQLLIGAGVGLALQGKIPICYSVTSFLLYRPFEFIRNYLHHENIPVKLLGGGINKDYGNLGFSHWSEEYEQVLSVVNNIYHFKPETPEGLKLMFHGYIYGKQPAFMGLRRENH